MALQIAIKLLKSILIFINEETKALEDSSGVMFLNDFKKENQF